MNCSNPQIMILEDDIDQLKIYKTMLERQIKATFICFANSELAIQSLLNPEYAYTAFVLDIELKGQKYTGIEVAEKIREYKDNLNKPIVFISSFNHFSHGSLNYLHYFDFINKKDGIDKIIKALENALFINSKETHLHENLVLKTCQCDFELNPHNLTCIELFRNEITIIDLEGNSINYKVPPHTFQNVCSQIKKGKIDFLQQVHRCIIINIHRIKKIVWGKNTAQVWLFNVADSKPVGKTYLKILNIFK